MRTEEIWTGTIEEAAEDILNRLKEKANSTRSINSRDNVFYFDGWDGLGASAVLRAISTPTSPSVKRALSQLKFDQVIHIDCSMWESRRTLQKAVAEQLKMPDEVMELFDRQDEQDDFRGVAQGSRSELQEVIREMHQHIQKLNHRFLVIFHNGSSEEIDLANCCGFPLSGFSTSKVLWTFQGRFRLKPRMKVDIAMKRAGTTDAFIWATSSDWEKDPGKLWSYLIHQETTEVAVSYKINTRPHDTTDLQTAQVLECFLYMLELCRGCHNWLDYDFSTHGANYLVCDGIIHQPNGEERHIGLDDDNGESWREAEALQREIQLDVDYHQFLPSSPLARFVQSKPYWASPTCGLTRIPIPARAIPNGDNMFLHCSDKLRVLKLSRCTFNFQSPPFVCCHSLRFLWLDHCQGTGNNTDAAGKEEVRQCFQRLWVLGVHYTDHDQILSAQMLGFMGQLKELNVMGAKDWDIGQLQGRLPDIRKLRVTKSAVSCSCSENDLFLDMKKMELLDFSRSGFSTRLTMRLYGPGATSNSRYLKTVIINDGCHGLKGISFRGCTKMKNLFLGGIMLGVLTIDISGTAVKTLDLTTTLFSNLHELHLLDCKSLCAILWPPKDNMPRDLAKLCIDTTHSASTAQSREENDKKGTTATTETSASAVLHGSEFPWHISVRDARLLVSLEAVFSESRKLYVDVSSPTARPCVAAGGDKDEGISSEQQVMVSLQQRRTATAIYAADSIMDRLLQQACEGNGGDSPGFTWMWPCPDVPELPQGSCYMHIQADQTSTELLPLGCEKAITVPEFVIDCAKILHVHDSLSITSFPSAGTKYLGSEWHMLEWCRIERCPKLNSVFTSGENDGCKFIYSLRVFWGSHLSKAHYIWEWGGPPKRTFPDLTFLHLDFCPRLIHVLPLSTKTFTYSTVASLYDYILSQLKTLEIMWCGDLLEVFPLDTYNKMIYEEQLPTLLDFPSLKRIHLHELPTLQRICGVRMSAPNLETVKIRGCWSLRRLPDVGGGNKLVECDCEKEWWENLEWDDNSQASRYKPIHSRYYKKTLLRGSVLR